MKTLKELIKESGRSREWLAVAVDKSKQTIDNWCSGKVRPCLSDCKVLALEMGVTDQEVQDSLPSKDDE